MSEFGFRDGQMRHPYTVKNASVFEVTPDTHRGVTQVLFHGDVDDNDILSLMVASLDEGRTFFIFHEENIFGGWWPWLRDQLDVDVDKFKEMATIVVQNGEMFRFSTLGNVIATSF